MKPDIRPPQADPILQEVWRIKDELSASYGHDIKRLFEITRAHEEELKQAGRRIVDLSTSKKNDLEQP